MSLLWLAIGDEPSSESDRAYIERNCIALLSASRKPLDLASPGWLGRFSQREAIRKSGLWNVNYVGEPYDPSFLDVLSHYVEVTIGRQPYLATSFAPKGWLRAIKAKHDPAQLGLFDDPSSHER
jgi:hypothetical protein